MKPLLYPPDAPLAAVSDTAIAPRLCSHVAYAHHKLTETVPSTFLAHTQEADDAFVNVPETVFYVHYTQS